MKSFPLTVWSVIALFTLIMIVVATLAMKKENSLCKIDPAQIRKIREHQL